MTEYPEQLQQSWLWEELYAVRNIKPSFLNAFFDPGNRYSVPYAYTVTLLGYNIEKLRALDLPTDTWALIFEPRYLARLKGRVTVLDSQRELMAAALRYRARSPRRHACTKSPFSAPV